MGLSYRIKNHLKYMECSGQYGGIGRNAWLPSTMKRRTTNNLKTISNLNCQISKLYGTTKAKELKKHSSRLVGGAETGSRQAGRTCGKAVDHMGKVGLAHWETKTQNL